MNRILLGRLKKRSLRRGGFTLIEMFAVVTILSAMIGAVYLMMATGQTAWFNTDAQIELQSNLRRSFEKISRELQESGSDKNGTMQVTLFDGTGVNGTDIIRFSMPILCQAGVSIIDSNGDVANWGAPLTWGCTVSTCMDADNDCSTREYRYIEYLVDNSNQLIRRILDNGGVQVRQDIMALNITNLQASLSADQNLVTVILTGQTQSVLKRTLTASTSVDVYLRNRG